MFEKNELYIGIDLGYETAMISLYHSGMKDVRTISAVTGEEKYQIPTALLKTENGQIFYGEEALRRAEMEPGSFYQNLYENALREQSGGIYHQCLQQFLRRLIRFKDRFSFGKIPAFLSVTVPELTADAVRLLQETCEGIGFLKGNYTLCDYRESFFEHTCHQETSIWKKTVLLFHVQQEMLVMWALSWKEEAKFCPVAIVQEEWHFGKTSGIDARSDTQMDTFFAEVLQEVQKRYEVSGIYLVGEVFEQGWLKMSLKVLQKDIRVFVGKNLFTRGACYGAFRRRQQPDWKYRYHCPYQYAADVSLRIMQKEEEQEYFIARDGENWFEGETSLRFLYNGDPKIDFAIQKAGKEERKICSLILSDLPKRDNRSIRLLMRVVPKESNRIRIEVTEDGFGTLFAASGKKWNCEISWEETTQWEN